MDPSIMLTFVMLIACIPVVVIWMLLTYVPHGKRLILTGWDGKVHMFEPGLRLTCFMCGPTLNVDPWCASRDQGSTAGLVQSPNSFILIDPGPANVNTIESVIAKVNINIIACITEWDPNVISKYKLSFYETAVSFINRWIADELTGISTTEMTYKSVLQKLNSSAALERLNHSLRKDCFMIAQEVFTDASINMTDAIQLEQSYVCAHLDSVKRIRQLKDQKTECELASEISKAKAQYEADIALQQAQADVDRRIKEIDAKSIANALKLKFECMVNDNNISSDIAIRLIELEQMNSAYTNISKAIAEHKGSLTIGNALSTVLPSVKPTL